MQPDQPTPDEPGYADETERMQCEADERAHAAYERGKAEQAAEVERLQVLLDHAEQHARNLQDDGDVVPDEHFEEPVTLLVRQPSAEVLAELEVKFAEAMAHPARLVVLPNEDEREQAAYERGRREATEGWEREWQAEVPEADYWTAIDEEQVPHLPGWPKRSRLVGPWEPADQHKPKEADRG